MALPTPPPVTDPIPNNPFYAPLNPYVCGPYFPVAVSAGIDITTGATVPQLTNDVQNVLVAGPGIALSTLMGVTTITATGGGGGGGVTAVTGTAPIVSSGGTTPDISINASSPSAIGAIAGYTDITDTDFNTALGYCALNSGAGAGFANVAVGIASGYALTAGSYGNTLIGPGTGCAIDTGTVNTAIGIGALSALTSGFANVGIGICSGCAYTTESGNAVLGGHPGNAGDINALILSDGAGSLKAKFDSLGALSFDGINYGTAGQVLSSNGPGVKPTWISAGSSGVTAVNGTAPIVSSGGTTPTISVSNATPLTRGVLIGRSGGSNTSVGENALRAITAGQSNTALGFDALCSVTSSVSNTAVGDSAASKVTGTQNAAVGGGALFNNATGDCNTAMGNFAMMFSSGSCNSALGHNSLRTTSGINNVGVGINAGSSLTSGNNNVAIGPSAQVLSATGSCQLAIGFSTTDNWLTGDSTKAIKPGAGILDLANSTGTNGQVLMSNGSNAVCWGTVSVASATPTTQGIMFGCTCSSSFFNVSLGFCANAGNGGTFGTAIGTEALKAITNGGTNTGVGYQAGTAVTSGQCNTTVGAYAGRSVTSGIGVTAVGRSALCLATGSGNVGLGAQVGNLVTSGSNNTLLGTCAGCNLTTGSNNVAIGISTALASAAGSCQLSIGFSATDNWLTGDSTKAIRPGAGIIDSTGSTGTVGQALLSTGGNAVIWGSAGVPGWTTDGTATSKITGVTTNPSPGNVGINNVYYRQLGAKEYEAVYMFNQSAPGSAGSGDYLFTLPAGLQFDTTLFFQSPRTFNLGVNSVLFALPGPSLGHITDGTNFTTVSQPFVYNATQFRIANVQGSSVNVMGSSVFPFSTFGLGFSFRFQFTTA